MDPLLNAQTVAAIQHQRQMGLGWRYDGLGDWTSEAIFAKLLELNIDTDRECFADQAQQAGRCSELRQTWTRGKERYDLWDDFPYLAAEELWHRLTPDLLCPEIVRRHLDHVIRTSEGGSHYRPDAEKRPVLLAAAPLLDYLESFPTNELATRYKEVSDGSLYDYGEVLLDAIMNEGGDLPDEAIRVADLMSQADPDRATSFQGDLPFALMYAGRREQALAHIQANLVRFPDDVWIRVHAGDVYEELGEEADALEFYISALNAAIDPMDWEAFRDRIMEVLAKLGRVEEWTAIQREAPCPTMPAGTSWTYSTPSTPPLKSAAFHPPASAAPFQKGLKIGVNDPCPCGSGKKYKKCCKR